MPTSETRMTRNAGSRQGNSPRRSPSPPSPRSRLSADERREQILEQAAQIFSDRGYEGARTKEIAQACGVTEAVIYRHFHGKQALFNEALEKRIQDHQVEAFLAGLSPDLPLQETFGRIALKMLEIGLGDPILHRLLLQASLFGPEETHGLYLSWRVPFIDHLQDVIRAGIERGELREVNPLLTARAFVGLVMDCVLSCNLWSEMGQTQFTPGELVANNVPTFVLGLVKDRGDFEREDRG